MDLKNKIISFLKDKKVNEEIDPSEEEWLNDVGVVKLKHCTLGVRDPGVDREAIESIEERFFQDASLDAVQIQLSRFKELPDQQHIETMCASLKTQLQAVSRKISDLVLDNQATYTTELERVTTLQSDLQSALQTCLTSRRCLNDASSNFTTAGLQLLANHRRRGLLKRLLSSLHTIKTLQRTDNKLKELLKEENFPGAIHLSLEYEKAASTYKHYNCISELSIKLRDNSELVDEALDVALSRTCLAFNHHFYTRIQHAYRLLGKSQVAADQLHMHYISCVHVTSFNMVLAYVEMCSGTAEEGYQKKQFQDLCACLKTEVYVRCLVELCGVLWRVVCSYKLSTEWHASHDSEEGFFNRASSPNKYNGNHDENNNNTDNNNNNNNAQNDTSNNSSNNDLQQLDLSSIHYVRNKLEVGKSKLWTEIQLKVKIYLLSHDLSHFQYEDFMSVLDVINKLVRIGHDFCGSGSEGLEEAVQKLSSCYFKVYHGARVEEMRVFVENEGWVLCPVKSTFHLTKLQEFKFLKSRQSVGSSSLQNFFTTYLSSGSPFQQEEEGVDGEGVIKITSGAKDQNNNKHQNNHATPDKDKHNDDEDDDDDDDGDDDDIDENLKGDFLDEECRNGDDDDDDGYSWNLTKAVHKQPSVISIRATPILTNCTLCVCKLFGRYMNMMSSLNCISYDVIKSMTQLIDFYFYAVYETFSDEKDQEILRVSSKFRSVVERVRDSFASLSSPPLFPTPQQPPLILPSTNHNNHDNHNNSSTQLDGTKRPTETHRRTNNRTNNKTHPSFEALKARVVSTESLLFLSAQFKELEALLYEAIPERQRGLLDQYFLQTLSVVAEIRTPIYRAFVRQHLNTREALHLMTMVTWDLEDIMSQHSAYVDVLLQEVGKFKGSLVDFSTSFPLPQPVVDSIWSDVSLLCCETLLEGFSACKRCSNEGRALMMLDFQQFLLKFHKLSSLRPVPGQAFVEGYIKAFYLPETELEKWISSCHEYSSKQLTSLIGCLGGLSRKSRQKLLTLVEEDKNKK